MSAQVGFSWGRSDPQVMTDEGDGAPLRPGSPAAGKPTRSTTTAAVVHSSAAFLHHLHHGPSSHHITLSASASRGGSAPNKSPRSISIPLEPTVVERNKPTDGPAGQPHLSRQDSTAGPSTLRGLGRTNSRRGRPNTAPAKNDVSDAAFSPDIEDSRRLGEEYDATPEELPQILPEDVCGMSLPGEDEARDAMEHAVGGTPRSGSMLLGSSGSLGKAAEPAASFSNVRPSSSPEALSWKTFAKSYAHGLFEPNRVPNPPQDISSPVDPPSVHSSPGKRYAPSSVAQRRAETATSASSQGTLSSTSGSSNTTFSNTSTSAPIVSNDKNIPAQQTLTGLTSKMKALELENLPGVKPPAPTFMKPDKLALPSYSLAAATVRMASSSLRESDFAPLGMPSPERELMDPMSSVVSDAQANSKDSPSSDSGIGRFPLSRSMSSAVGSGQMHAPFLPTIQASPVSTPSEHPHKRTSPLMNRGGVTAHRIPAATAPIERVAEAESSVDYFGSIAAPHYERQQSSTSHSSSSQTVTERGTPAVGTSASNKNSAPPSARGSPDFQLPPIAYPQDVGAIFEKVGWLAAPVPPQELERRKALYRFGILHTAKDINFDRIAHMAKLVFNTKIVLIALTDTDTQWHKSQTGLGVDEAKRISSFCSHTILSK